MGYDRRINYFLDRCSSVSCTSWQSGIEPIETMLNRKSDAGLDPFSLDAQMLDVLIGLLRISDPDVLDLLMEHITGLHPQHLHYFRGTSCPHMQQGGYRTPAGDMLELILFEERLHVIFGEHGRSTVGRYGSPIEVFIYLDAEMRLSDASQALQPKVYDWCAHWMAEHYTHRWQMECTSHPTGNFGEIKPVYSAIAEMVRDKITAEGMRHSHALQFATCAFAVGDLVLLDLGPDSHDACLPGDTPDMGHETGMVLDVAKLPCAAGRTPEFQCKVQILNEAGEYGAMAIGVPIWLPDFRLCNSEDDYEYIESIQRELGLAVPGEPEEVATGFVQIAIDFDAVLPDPPTVRLKLAAPGQEPTPRLQIAGAELKLQISTEPERPVRLRLESPETPKLAAVAAPRLQVSLEPEPPVMLRLNSLSQLKSAEG